MTIPQSPAAEEFTDTELAVLAPRFTNTERGCFALRNLPETVKGALFARYSRSAKSLRRLYLDEFASDVTLPPADEGGGRGRAERLYQRVLGEYGDDSVAQLGSAHVACEGVSNLLTKVLERGRLMSYLEQSTRYVPYTERPDGHWKYATPTEITDLADRRHYRQVLDHAFETYAYWLGRAETHFRRLHPPDEEASEAAYARAVRARALDAVRGLLPAATRSNLGIHGSGQAFEALLLRLGAHELAEAREMGNAMLAELRQVIPAFVERVDRADRGGLWREYLRERNASGHRSALAIEMAPPNRANPRRSATAEANDAGAHQNEVRLVDWDRNGEVEVLAATLHPYTDQRLEDLREQLEKWTPAARRAQLLETVGERRNRRHRPGRGFEHTTYTFEITGDYGAFRDLQRHRMLTIDWQALTTRHGASRNESIDEMGALEDWTRVITESAELYERLQDRYGMAVAQYAVPMACRIRFTMRMNAREAMHVIELRTQPAGHPSYRRVCQQMHDLIRDEAGHEGIAEAIRFADHSTSGLGRLGAERRQEERRSQT